MRLIPKGLALLVSAGGCGDTDRHDQHHYPGSWSGTIARHIFKGDYCRLEQVVQHQTMAPSKTVRVAVTQHEPVWLDLDATVQKTCDLIAEAAGGGAKLVAFPETWIPGYPAWIWYGLLSPSKRSDMDRSRPVDFDLGVKYVENSLSVDSPQMRKICETAAENAINVSLGFSERAGSTVYIAQAFIDEAGKIKVKRRKMKPTHMERTVRVPLNLNRVKYPLPQSPTRVTPQTCFH